MASSSNAAANGAPAPGCSTPSRFVPVLDFPDRVPAVRGGEFCCFPGVAAPGDCLDDLAEQARHHAGGHVYRSDDLRWLDDSRKPEIVFQKGNAGRHRRARVRSHQQILPQAVPGAPAALTR
jgi:hypothetical protein